MVHTLESNLVPGTYRLAELEELLGRTRKTVERYIERFGLEKTEIDYSGRKVLAVSLTSDSIERIRTEIGDSLESTGSKTLDPHVLPSSLIGLHEQEKESLLEQLKASHSELIRLEMENARLAAKAESHEQLLSLKDEAIEAKDETIQSLKTSMVVLERANKQLEGEKRLIGDKQHPSVAYAPMDAKPLGFWNRLKYAFGTDKG
jgi:chromosome segregation ATPase